MAKLAQVRADEIADCGEECHNHIHPDGSGWSAAISNIRQFKGTGENLVEYAKSDNESVKTWKTSDLHNSNMLGLLPEQTSDWLYTGTAVAYGEKCKCNIYVTEFA